MLLNLLAQDNIIPKQATANEYHSSCPGCGGKDRFCVFLDSGRYWCRQCGKQGDTIQYLRNFRGMSFQEAANVAGKEVSCPPNQLYISQKKLSGCQRSALSYQTSGWRMQECWLTGRRKTFGTIPNG